MYPQDAYVGNTCDTFVSYTIHLGYILGYTPDSGYIYNTSAIHVSYVLWCIATCIVRITNLTLGSSVSQMYLCAIHVSCMYCDVSWAIRRDTSRYVAIRRIEGERYQVWGKRVPHPRGCTVVPLQGQRVARFRPLLVRALGLDATEGTHYHRDAVDGLPIGNRYRAACLGKIDGFSQTYTT